jgi:hypothetical protein
LNWAKLFRRSAVIVSALCESSRYGIKDVESDG